MRLEATARFTLKKQVHKAFWTIIFMLLLHAGHLDGQNLQLSFSTNTTLSDALLKSSKEFHFKVAFDAGRLEQVYINKTVAGDSKDEFLENLLNSTGFTFLFKHGCYLIVDDNKETAPLKVLTEHSVSGVIMDAENNEQLPFATIVLPDQSITLSATSNGTFSVKGIISNPLHVMVTFIGYNPVDTFLQLAKTVTESLVIRMRPSATRLKSVDIIRPKADIIDLRDNVDFAATINPARLMDMPVMVETDIFRSLQLLPGISYTEGSAELNIRGGTNDQNLVLFDGQTLYNLSHYYGVFSSINPNIVKDIQVFKGGFDSRYGERISGIVDITGKSGNQFKPVIAGDINLLSVNLAVELPLAKNLTILAAGRRSYSDIYSTTFADRLFDSRIPVRQGEGDTVTVSRPDFRFYDVNAKINYRISKNENLSLNFYKGNDNYRNRYNIKFHERIIESSDSNVWNNSGMSVNWQKQWTSLLFSSVVAGTSGYENVGATYTLITNKIPPDGNIQPYLPDSQNVFLSRIHNELKDFSFCLRNSFALNYDNLLDFGILVRRNNVSYSKEADRIYVYDNFSQTSWISSFYIQDRITLGKKLIVKPGIRVSWYNGTNSLYFEPRFAARFGISENLSVRVATGKYDQFISQVVSQQETGYIKNFWMLANDTVHPVLKAKHIVAGITWQKNRFVFDAELYYKIYKGQQEYLFASPYLKNNDFKPPRQQGSFYTQSRNLPPVPIEKAVPSYFITGLGKSCGLDFLLSYRSKRYYGWLSYTLSKNVQRYDSINNGGEIPAFTDQVHQISFTSLFELGKWNLGAIALFSTGRPYVANLKDSASSVTRNYRRLPNYFRFDLSASYRFNIKSVKIKTGVSIINLFNSANYYDINSRSYNFDNGQFNETNLVQSQRLSLNVFLHFQL